VLVYLYGFRSRGVGVRVMAIPTGSIGMGTVGLNDGNRNGNGN